MNQPVSAGRPATDGRPGTPASAGKRKKQKFKHKNNAAFAKALGINHFVIHKGQSAGLRSNDKEKGKSRGPSPFHKAKIF
jgi:hypothetical protein